MRRHWAAIGAGGAISLASFYACSHLLNGLAAKLFALQFTAGRGDRLVVAAFRRIFKAEIAAVYDRAEIGEAVSALRPWTSPANPCAE